MAIKLAIFRFMFGNNCLLTGGINMKPPLIGEQKSTLCASYGGLWLPLQIAFGSLRSPSVKMGVYVRSFVTNRLSRLVVFAVVLVLARRRARGGLRIALIEKPIGGRT